MCKLAVFTCSHCSINFQSLCLLHKHLTQGLAVRKYLVDTVNNRVVVFDGLANLYKTATELDTDGAYDTDRPLLIDEHSEHCGLKDDIKSKRDRIDCDCLKDAAQDIAVNSCLNDNKTSNHSGLNTFPESILVSEQTDDTTTEEFSIPGKLI